MASRTVARLTPKATTSSASVGNRSSKSPRPRRRLSSAASCAQSGIGSLVSSDVTEPGPRTGTDLAAGLSSR